MSSNVKWTYIFTTYKWRCHFFNSVGPKLSPFSSGPSACFELVWTWQGPVWTWPLQHAPSRGWSFYILLARVSGRFTPLPFSLKHHFPSLLPHSGHHEGQSGMYGSKQKLQLSCKDPLVDSDACCHIRHAKILELKQSARVFKVTSRARNWPSVTMCHSWEQNSRCSFLQDTSLHGTLLVALCERTAAAAERKLGAGGSPACRHLPQAIVHVRAPWEPCSPRATEHPHTWCVLSSQHIEMLILGDFPGAPKLEKEYDKGVYCHSVYLISMQSTPCEMPGWMNHKLESSYPGEISKNPDMQMIPLYWQKVKRN